MAAIFVRTILLYALLTLLFRLMGRRQVGELDVSELISTLLLSEIASLPIDDPDIPLLFAVVPIVVIVCVEVALTALRVHSRRAKRLLGASPVLLIDRGRICQQTLGRMRITVEELLSECRQKGFGRPDEIEYAVLEENGKLSILPKARFSPLTPSDTGQKTEEKGLMHPLIIDGVPSTRALSAVGMDEAELRALCRARGWEPADVFLCGRDDSGAMTWIKKEPPVPKARKKQTKQKRNPPAPPPPDPPRGVPRSRPGTRPPRLSALRSVFARADTPEQEKRRHDP